MENSNEPKKRGRPPKNKEKMATKEQLDFIEQSIGEPLDDFIGKVYDEYKTKYFANTIYKSVNDLTRLTTKSSSNGSYQPILSEQTFQDVNINPKVASSEEIEKWLLSPQYYDQNLRHLSQYLSYSVGQYNRALWYLNTIKSYNYVPKFPYCSEEDENSPIYKEDETRFYQILEKMNIKYNIPKIDAAVMFDGICPVYIVETNDTISVHIIPADYTYVTAPWTFGYTFAIDLTYFDRFAMLDNQVPELIEAYKLFVEKRKALYKGDALAPYQYYNVPPERGWVFTFDPIHPDKLPPMTSSMGSSLDILSYKELLKNKLALDLYKIIALKIPLDKNGDKMAVNYELAQEITQVIQAQLPDNVKAYSSPFESLPIATDQTNRFDEIIGIANDSFSTSTGFNQGVFGSSDAKQGTALQLSLKVDFSYASTHMYNQYANFINYQIAIRTKKYRFGVRFFGNKIDEQKEIEMYSSLVRTTNTGTYHLYGSVGIEPHEIESYQRHENKLKAKMQPIVSAFNGGNSNSDDAGRTAKNSSDLTDSGAITRDYESNVKSFSHNKICILCGKELGINSVNGKFCDDICKTEFLNEIMEDGE